MFLFEPIRRPRPGPEPGGDLSPMSFGPQARQARPEPKKALTPADLIIFGFLCLTVYYCYLSRIDQIRDGELEVYRYFAYVVMSLVGSGMLGGMMGRFYGGYSYGGGMMGGMPGMMPGMMGGLPGTTSGTVDPFGAGVGAAQPVQNPPQGSVGGSVEGQQGEPLLAPMAAGPGPVDPAVIGGEGRPGNPVDVHGGGSDA